MIGVFIPSFRQLFPNSYFWSFISSFILNFFSWIPTLSGSESEETDSSFEASVKTRKNKVINQRSSRGRKGGRRQQRGRPADYSSSEEEYGAKKKGRKKKTGTASLRNSNKVRSVDNFDFHISPWIQDVTWTYRRRSEDVLEIIQTSYVRVIYVMCPGGIFIVFNVLVPPVWPKLLRIINFWVL